MILRNQKKKLNKKGVSVIIGYVLLVAFAIIISVGVYAWLKTYVPREPLNCPDGLSVFAKGTSFNSSTSQLIITVRNNGRFDVAGYFIYAANDSEKKNPSIDVSTYLIDGQEGIKFGNSVLFSVTGSNSMKPGEERTNTFSIPLGMGELYSIRVVPTRFQEENGRQRFVSCSNAAVQQIVGAPTGCTADCSGKVCGSDGCGGSCGACNTGFSCDALGQCYSNSCTPASNPTLLGVCGSFVCGTKTNGTCGSVNCGTCNTNATCNIATGLCVSNCGNGVTDTNETCDDGGVVSGNGCSSTCQVESGYSCTGSPSTCTLLCGNGIINSGEGCDDSNRVNGDGCSSTCQVESGYSCAGQPSACSINIVSCPSYCVSLGLGYSSIRSSCTNSPGNCVSNGGTYQSGGDQWCTGGAQADTCCCKV